MTDGENILLSMEGDHDDCEDNEDTGDVENSVTTEGFGPLPLEKTQLMRNSPISLDRVAKSIVSSDKMETWEISDDGDCHELIAVMASSSKELFEQELRASAGKIDVSQ